MELGLGGKRAVVTGASQGIGLAITRRLVDEGATVYAASRHLSEELEQLAGGQLTHVPADLATASAPGELATAVLADGPVDILVNNAGAVTPRPDGFLSVTDEQWLASFTLTFMAAVRVTRSLLPHLRTGGSIVNTASVNASLPDPLVIDYSAAKAALTNFSKALSKEVGPTGIRVNTVSPGPVATGLWLGAEGVAATVGRATGSTPADVAQGAVSGTPSGRFTEPQEVADLVLFLVSDRAGNITGADFVIDGGLIQTL